jgi:hypothetical protein
LLPVCNFAALPIRWKEKETPISRSFGETSIEKWQLQEKGIPSRSMGEMSVEKWQLQEKESPPSKSFGEASV